MKRRVIGVVRVSTANQAAEDRYGVERQRFDIKATAQAHDLEIVRTIEVVESGSTAFNGADFTQMFADLERPDIAGVAISAIDRLVRPGYLGDLHVFDPFQRHKKLIFTPGPVIDVESEAGWLVSGMFGLSAGLEKRAILKRTSSGKERARAAGKHPSNERFLPRGLDFIRERDERGKIVRAYWQYGPDAKKVLKAYDLLFQGMSFEDIALKVGFATGRGVSSILRNTVWKAVRTFPPNSLRSVPLEVPMGIEPLISATRWAEAQKVLDQKLTTARARKRQDRQVSLALGLLRCACGKFHYMRRDYRPGQFDLLYCSSRHPSGPGCGAPSLRRIDVDREVATAITEYLLSPKVLGPLLQRALQAAAVKPARNRSKTQKDIAGIQAERERLIDLRMKGLITLEEFEQRAAKLATAMREFEAELPQPETRLDERALAAAIAKRFAKFAYLPAEDQHTLARRSFVAFDVAQGNLVGFTMRGNFLEGAYAKNIQLSSSMFSA